MKWYSPETAPQPDGTAAVVPVFRQQQAVATLQDPTPTILIDQPAEQVQASLLQQLMENLENLQHQQQLVQKPETVANAQWPPAATSTTRHQEWSSLPGSWIGDSIVVSQPTIVTLKSYLIMLQSLIIYCLDLCCTYINTCSHTCLCLVTGSHALPSQLGYLRSWCKALSFESQPQPRGGDRLHPPPHAA